MIWPFNLYQKALAEHRDKFPKRPEDIIVTEVQELSHEQFDELIEDREYDRRLVLLFDKIYYIVGANEERNLYEFGEYRIV